MKKCKAIKKNDLKCQHEAVLEGYCILHYKIHVLNKNMNKKNRGIENGEKKGRNFYKKLK